MLSRRRRTYLCVSSYGIFRNCLINLEKQRGEATAPAVCSYGHGIFITQIFYSYSMVCSFILSFFALSFSSIVPYLLWTFRKRVANKMRKC